MRFLTAGESHGPSLMAILEGMPAGLSLQAADIDRELIRRQQGHGRGGRMKIEQDRVTFLAGVRLGQTLGSPICMQIGNKDWDHWQHLMGPEAESPTEGSPPGTSPLSGPVPASGKGVVTKPRPGHADLVGAMKYAHHDMRNILERASARETAARTAVGAVSRRLLAEFDIEIFGHIVALGPEKADLSGLEPAEVRDRAEASPVRCADPAAAERMMRHIDQAKLAGDTVGGVYEVVATGVPPGLGSHVHWDRKLDARLAMAIVSIQAMKGVEIGMGFGVGHTPGSQVHDEIFWDEARGFYRGSNNAGGLEAGMSTGQPIVIRGVMKPIATLYNALQSVDMRTKTPFKANVQRSDVCSVPPAVVVAEAVIAFELACAFQEKFAGDSVSEMRRNYEGYRHYLQEIEAWREV